jgi:GTPase SAR1 family protein
VLALNEEQMFGLCVTKSDADDLYSTVGEEEIKEFQRLPQIFIHMNVSSKTGNNVQELFSAIAEILSASVKHSVVQ